MRASKLLGQLAVYYLVIGLIVWIMVKLWPDARGYLPIGGVESLITQPSQNPLQGTDAILMTYEFADAVRRALELLV